MSDEMLHLNKQERLDDQMMDIDLIPSDGRSAHYAIASVVVRMDGQASDSPDLVSFAERLVSRYNACTGMADPAAEIAELKRQRDELLDEFDQIMKFYDVDSVAGLIRAQEDHILRLQESVARKPFTQIIASSPVRGA